VQKATDKIPRTLIEQLQMILPLCVCLKELKGAFVMEVFSALSLSDNIQYANTLQCEYNTRLDAK
jgi:hypothetical protein